MFLIILLLATFFTSVGVFYIGFINDYTILLVISSSLFLGSLFMFKSYLSHVSNIYIIRIDVFEIHKYLRKKNEAKLSSVKWTVKRDILEVRLDDGSSYFITKDYTNWDDLLNLLKDKSINVESC